MLVVALEEIKEIITDLVLQEKLASPDPVILIGGDMNKRDISGCFDDYDDIYELDHGPTRGQEKLDRTFTNISEDGVEHDIKIVEPLESQNGSTSDHKCVVAQFCFKNKKNFTWIRSWARKRSRKGNEKFCEMVELINWDTVYNGASTPTQMVQRLQAKLLELMDVCFPLKLRKRRSDEDPWITDAIRRKIRIRLRIFLREGRRADGGGWINK